MSGLPFWQPPLNKLVLLKTRMMTQINLPLINPILPQAKAGIKAIHIINSLVSLQFFSQ